MELPYDKSDIELKLLPETMQLSLMRVGTLLTAWGDDSFGHYRQHQKLL